MYGVVSSTNLRYLLKLFIRLIVRDGITANIFRALFNFNNSNNNIQKSSNGKHCNL